MKMQLAHGSACMGTFNIKISKEDLPERFLPAIGQSAGMVTL